jgi:hypothetical protein
VIITDHDLDRQCHLRKISLMFVSFFIFVQLVKRFCLQALASVAGSAREVTMLVFVQLQQLSHTMVIFSHIMAKIQQNCHALLPTNPPPHTPLTNTTSYFMKNNIPYYLISFLAPDDPPLNVTVTAETSSSLSVTWEPPEKDKRNGIIVSYTVCISHEESKPCFRQYTTKKKMIVIDNLIDSTKYYVRVLASTKVGRGPYSESTGKFTNGSKCRLAFTRNATFINMRLVVLSCLPKSTYFLTEQPEVSTNGKAYTLTFSLEIPSGNFT